MTFFLPSHCPYLPLATVGMAGPHEHLLSQGLDALGLSLVRSYGTHGGLQVSECHGFVTTRPSPRSPPHHPALMLFVPPLLHVLMWDITSNFYIVCLAELEILLKITIEVFWILFLNSLCGLSLQSNFSYNTGLKELFGVIKKKYARSKTSQRIIPLFKIQLCCYFLF